MVAVVDDLESFTGAEDTMLLAYLIDPGRAEYDLDDLMAEYGVELEPDPPAEEETARLVRHAEAARRLAPPLHAKVVERGSERLYRDVELPLTVVLGAMEDTGVRIDTYRMGEITARLADRIEELEAKASAVYGNHRGVVGGQEVGENEIREILRFSDDESLRREATLARFLPAWQGAGRPRGGPDALYEAIERLQAALARAACAA
jgi:hypothetical protein